MQDWTGYILGFAFFFASHMIPVKPRVKAGIISIIGARGFTIAYSLLSTLALILLIVAARRAPYLPLWDWQEWHNHLAMALMLVAVVIIAMAIGRPNPLSFGGANNDAFDPADPGLIGWTHHPLLLALFLWSCAHLLANGDLAHVIMFACFAGFSLLGRKIINRRKIRQLGDKEWTRISTTTRNLHPSFNGSMRVGIGLVIYALVLWAHDPVIGISPIP
ncbi:NnrU family protein [Aliiroseovarius crassostreae]|uniref:NnrU family protein n=1 Tax=Aliiroseovarius crassostreae TaxID=154981 RepID=UPI003C7D8ED6